MFTPLLEQHARATAEERQRRADAENRARHLVTIRRWQRKADHANHQVRQARLALR